MRFVSIAILCLMLGTAWAANDQPAEVRDPFAPFVGAGAGRPGDLPGNESAPPLLKYPADAYALIGVMTSAKAGVAVVQTPSGSTFYVRVGDALGADGYSVSAMSEVSVKLNNKRGKELVLTTLGASGG